MARTALSQGWIESVLIYKAAGPEISYLLVPLVTVLLYILANLIRQRSKPPLINPPKLLDLRQSRPKLEFLKNSKELLLRGKEIFKGRPFRVRSERGDVTVLPYEMAHDMRNEHNLSFDRAVYDVGSLFKFPVWPDKNCLNFDCFYRHWLTNWWCHISTGLSWLYSWF